MQSRIIFISLIFVSVCCVFGQELGSSYNYHDVFSPLFYNNNGNKIRSASGIPGIEYWQNRADYKIKAKIDDKKHYVTASVEILYTNNSTDDLNFLWLQLDQNLFKPNSRGEAMISGKSRYGARGEKINGGYKISNLSTSKELDEYIIEDTRMQIRLKKPLQKNGDKISIKMDFEFLIPINGSDRMGHLSTKNGEVYTIAQWFPRMAVYDDILGWNTLPYLGAGEFYCEFGDIDLELTAPENHIVMASGELLNPKEVLTNQQYKNWQAAYKSDKTIHVVTTKEAQANKDKFSNQYKTWKYRIQNTRDAAWASSKAFVVDAAKINLKSGKPCLAISAHPEESATNDSYGRAAEYVKTSVEHYSDMWLEYPYPLAINIASNQGGMEYPGIVFCGWKAKNADCWGVIDHEFGHIWFPMIVGTNERKYGWMDEGFNTFINDLSAQSFNNGEYASNFLSFNEYFVRSEKQNTEKIFLIPDAMKEQEIGFQLYWKPGLGLKLLREVILGKDRFDYAFKHYIKSWAYKHPQPEDFFKCIENAAGEDLSWFWKSWFINNYKLDQAITNVKKSNNQLHVTIENLEQMPMPILLEIEFRDGTKLEHKQSVDVWMRNKTWTLSFDTEKDVKSVSLDANQVLPDINRQNNHWNKI